MTTKRGLMLGVLTVFLCSQVLAQEPPSPRKDGAETFVFEEMIITAQPETPETETLTKDILDWTRYIHIGDLIDDTPGVNAVRRGADASEPVIRGLGWERVQTQVGPIPIFGGCPARMDPPITYLQPDKVQKVLVVKGIPSVTLGPGGTGGRVIVSMDYERDPKDPPEFKSWLGSKWDGARNGIWGGGGVRGGNRRVDYYASVDGLNYGDYESARGIEVPADRRSYGGAVSVGFRPTENQRWWNGLNYVRDDGFDAPSLPMDSDETDTWIYNTGYRIERTGETLERIDIDGGFSLVNHLMSNRNKSNVALLRTESPTDSDSFAGRFKQDWRLAPTMVLTTGADMYRIDRDATRERFVVARNRTFFDHIWPDVMQSDWGLFSEFTYDFAPAWRLRLGGRFDQAHSDAKAVDDDSIGGLTIRQQFVNFFGPDAADVERDDSLAGGNVLLQWEAARQLTLHLGAGVISRPPNVTERYYAFAPSPGGFQLGNPTLDSEVKYEVDAGADWIRPWGVFSTSVFHYWVDGYILPTLIARQDVDGDGIIDNVRGFVNTDARLYGAEFSVVLKPFEHWSFPASISYVRGKQADGGGNLPEIPPLEARLAVRADYVTRSVPWWVEFGGWFAARQDKVSSEFPEDTTPGFAVFHIFAGAQPVKGLRLLVGIENLFDKDYHEHLTREVALATDDLSAGSEIPNPGRSFHAMMRYEF